VSTYSRCVQRWGLTVVPLPERLAPLDLQVRRRGWVLLEPQLDVGGVVGVDNLG
jgi:hypothetical protein